MRPPSGGAFGSAIPLVTAKHEVAAFAYGNVDHSNRLVNDRKHCFAFQVDTLGVQGGCIGDCPMRRLALKDFAPVLKSISQTLQVFPSVDPAVIRIDPL